MSRHAIVRFGIVLFIVVIVGVGVRYSGPVMAEIRTGVGIQYSNMSPFRIGISQPEAQSSQLAIVRSESQVESSVNGAILTQTFTLNEGWNSIYLEVEPINKSLLMNVGTAEEPIMAPELSTIEAVFADLTCADCLESVWTWNVPLTTVDYIMDPAEGLWDEPGWQHYFPEHNLSPDGVSRAFLTNLFSLQANKGYLVKLKDGGGSAILAVQGKPVVEHHHWLQDSYNLAGFPINPDASPTVATFFHNLAGGPSALTEVRALNADGTWGVVLPANTALDYGEAYLVYFNGGDPDAVTDYTAPLNIISYVGDGLEFTPGFSGNKQSLRIENLADVSASVELSLLGATTPEVALKFDSDPESDTDPFQSLWPGPESLTLAAGRAKELNFVVSSADQTTDGEALLEIRSPDLGARWLVPVMALRGDNSGLWIGEAVVNDVSEGRLGGTNVENGELTIALRPRDLSGIQGAAELVEIPAGNTASVAMTLTLALPTPEEPVVREPFTGTAPYLMGYVYVDSNQNGKPDAYDMGFAGVTVTLGGSANLSTQTAEDGSYLFEGLVPNKTYLLSIDPKPPVGYTNAFDVTEPATTEGAPLTTTPNTLPKIVKIDDEGVSELTILDYNNSPIVDTDFPRYDAEDIRVEPQLNFGFVPIYDASLWTGQCSDRLEWRRDLEPVVNGMLTSTMTSTALNSGYVVDDSLLEATSYALYIEEYGAGGAEGEGVACGEIVVGAPTRFEDGRGSDFRFRVLLRVDENGGTELLPDYTTTEDTRVSSANFSINEAIAATGADFGDTSGLLKFSILIDPEDPLNPYKHKYHPDHDNLDVKFNPIDFNTVAPYLWESYEVRRRIQLELTELPPVAGATELTAAELDWGGGVWGGRYKEVIEGIHKNDITVKGYFVIRHALAWEDLTPQDYDQSGGGGG